jgi:putative MFS transporter
MTLLDRRGEHRLVALLAPATFFEGYDNLILGLALPLIGREFGLTATQLGLVASIVFGGSFGVLLLLPLADRIGRRPVLAFTIVAYTVATFATAFSRGVVDVAYQFLARIFLGAEYALATIVLVDLLPRQRRGRALGLVSSMSAFGQAGAGIGFLAVVALGASWRVLYLVGIVPLVLVTRARRSLPETATWRTSTRLHRPWRETLEGVQLSWLGGASALSFLFAMFPTAVTTFASLLVLDEWRWSLKTLNPLYVLVWVLAVGGFFVAGRLLDAWGRRPTSAVFLFGATAAGMVAFRMSSTPGRVLGLGLVIFFLTGSTPCVAAYSTEPFPARSRGRVGAILRTANIAGAASAPALTGALARPLGGVGPALGVVGVSYALAAMVVLALLPETRGLDVDLAGEGSAGTGPTSLDEPRPTAQNRGPRPRGME